jgi:DNA-binding winged helix-turn-helix (wHTH) protein/Tfp pilus assembly protein PilF
MAGPPSTNSRLHRFATFEFDPRSLELWNGGVSIPLPDQSAKILATLLARPGEVVTREDLVAVLWPDGTHVDFDIGLNAAIRKLRKALEDSGDSPRYVETLPRRGYRLIVRVTSGSAEPTAPTAEASETVAAPVLVPRRRRRTTAIVLGTAGVLAAVSLILAVSGGANADRNRSSAAGWGRPSSNAQANGYFTKAQLFAGTGVHDIGRARELIERALVLDPKFGKARVEHGFYAFIMVLAGYVNDASSIYAAEQDIERGVSDDPTFSHGQAALAALALFHGKKEKSRRHAEMALEMNPRDVDARHWLAVNWWMSGQNQRAKVLERENLSQIPRFFPAHETLGEIAREEGDWAGSISELGQVLEYDPQNNFVLQALARTHMLAGNLPKARETLDRLRPEDRRSFRTRALEALLLALEGQRDGALKIHDAGVLSYLELNAFDTLIGAEIYSVLGETSQALQWLERAVRNGDERAEWFTRNPALASLRRLPAFQETVNSVMRRRAG